MTDMNFIPIKAGKFLMGSPENELSRYPNETQHEVTITQDFEIGETQVTQAQWYKTMKNNPSKFWGKDNPVENVSWNGVQNFIHWLNTKNDSYVYRLPTEAEWEYCCRVGKQTVYSYGDDPSALVEYAVYNTNQPAPVKSKYANAWGICDMHGNVWEWCQDWYDVYPKNTIVDPIGPLKGSNRVIRGGSWSSSAQFLRSAYLNSAGPGYRSDGVGFRLVRVKKSTVESLAVNSATNPKELEILKEVRCIRAKLTKIEKLFK